MAEYLIDHCGFKAISSRSKDDYSATSDARSNIANIPQADVFFKDISSLLNFVTRRWQERWVMIGTWDAQSLETLLRRPFFLLVCVDAPLSLRWQRFRSRFVFFSLLYMNKIAEQSESANATFRDTVGDIETMENFVLQNDLELYHSEKGLIKAFDRAHLRLLNSSSRLEGLYESLRKLNLENLQRLRPSWDQYFMQLASLAAQRSNCMKRRVGCVLVRDKRVISTGYNGTPRNIRNCNEGGCKHPVHSRSQAY